MPRRRLPEPGRPERMGRLSGYAWALGYAGGLVSLVIILLLAGRVLGRWMRGDYRQVRTRSRVSRRQPALSSRRMGVRIFDLRRAVAVPLTVAIDTPEQHLRLGAEGFP